VLALVIILTVLLAIITVWFISYVATRGKRYREAILDREKFASRVIELTSNLRTVTREYENSRKAAERYQNATQTYQRQLEDYRSAGLIPKQDESYLLENDGWGRFEE